LTGGLNVTGNHGGGPFPGDAAPEIVANTVRGGLTCLGNKPAPTNDGRPNTVTGARSGQCRSL
jgi:hypothetical protein